MFKAVLCFACLITLGQTRYDANWASLDTRPLPSWFDQSKVGIFLHWGVFSVPSFGSEWFWYYWQAENRQDIEQFMADNYKPKFTYQEFAPGLTAELFDPNQWADLFKDSGAKYVVLTSKHHEGYTLWPSKHSYSWNSVDVGPKRDLLGDLVTAIRSRTDLKFGTYYSLFEWFNPLYLNDKNSSWRTRKYVECKAYPELLDLVNLYKPDIIWSDGDWEAPDTYWNSTSFLAWLYNDSPVKDTVVVNDRWGIGTNCRHGGFYDCQDRFNPGTLQTHKWENAMTLDFVSWGYRREAQLKDYMTIQQLIHTLAQTISCGGNILINVGPTADGRIVPVFEERLRQLGAWLKVNGEAIYNSTPWTTQADTATSGVWYTQRTDLKTVYAIVTNWPKDNLLSLAQLTPSPGSTVTMLGFSDPLPWKIDPSNKAVQITFPSLTPDTDISKWAWVLKTLTAA